MSEIHQPYLRQLIETRKIPYGAGVFEECLSLGLDVNHEGNFITLRTPVELLDSKLIDRCLPGDGSVALEAFWSIDSTNTYLMSRAATAGPETYRVCLAEQQTAGRGRRGRQWISPFGTNLYMSIARHFRKESTDLGGLSLATGIQIVQSLRDSGVKEAGLKWPNDILLDGGKLAGILIEVSSPAPGDLYTVTGIGINLGLAPAAASQIDQPYSVLPVLGISRNELAGRLLSSVIAGMDRFAIEGFSPFRGLWPEFNLLQGMPVTVLLGDRRIQGDDAGIDAEGNLRLQSESGLQIFNAGEVSVRHGSA